MKTAHMVSVGSGELGYPWFSSKYAWTMSSRCHALRAAGAALLASTCWIGRAQGSVDDGHDNARTPAAPAPSTVASSETVGPTAPSGASSENVNSTTLGLEEQGTNGANAATSSTPSDAQTATQHDNAVKEIPTNRLETPMVDPYETGAEPDRTTRLRKVLFTPFVGAIWNSMGGADFDGTHAWEGGQGAVILPALSSGFGYLLGAGLYFGSPARGGRGFGGGAAASYSQTFHDTTIGSSIGVDGNGGTYYANPSSSDVGMARLNDVTLEFKLGWNPYDATALFYAELPVGFSWITSERGSGTRLMDGDQNTLVLGDEGRIMGLSIGVGAGVFVLVTNWFGFDASVAYRGLSSLGTGEGRPGRNGSGSGLSIKASPFFVL